MRQQQQIFAYICSNIAYMRQYEDMRIGKESHIAILSTYTHPMIGRIRYPIPDGRYLMIYTLTVN